MASEMSDTAQATAEARRALPGPTVIPDVVGAAQNMPNAAGSV
jgi:hypothetical protein